MLRPFNLLMEQRDLGFLKKVLEEYSQSHVTECNSRLYRVTFARNWMFPRRMCLCHGGEHWSLARPEVIRSMMLGLGINGVQVHELRMKKDTFSSSSILSSSLRNFRVETGPLNVHWPTRKGDSWPCMWDQKVQRAGKIKWTRAYDLIESVVGFQGLYCPTPKIQRVNIPTRFPLRH